MLPEGWLEDLKQRVDLVALGTRFGVDWGRSADGNAPKACCPFHPEKTPSFGVIFKSKAGHPIYHCYGGCGRSWDAIEFHRQASGSDFLTAVEDLARSVGLTVPRRPESAEAKAEREAHVARRERGFAALAAAQEWLAAALQEDSAEAGEARAYLAGRGFPHQGGDPFGLGHAPRNGWRLLRHLEAQGFGADVLEAAGLFKPAEGDRPARPRFWGRVTVPIRDRRGRVVGFAGRVLDAEGKPKYLNSPESDFFHKGELLYGLDLAAEEIRRRGRALVVEGHLDRVACHLADLTHCVAMQGTAFTAAHAEALRSLAPVVVFATDGDDAGRVALARALPVCLAAGLTSRAVLLPAGKDPDDVLRGGGRMSDTAGGPFWWCRLAGTGEDLLLWHARELAAAAVGPTDRDRVLRDELAPLVAQLGPVAREQYVKDLSKVFGVSRAAVREALGPAAEPASRGPESSSSPGNSPEGGPGIPPEDAGASALRASLAEFNRRHFKTWFGSASYVGRETLDEDGRETVQFVTEGDLTRYYSHVKFLVWNAAKGCHVWKELAKEWSDWEGVRTYERVVFRPSGAVSDDTYNLWRGLSVEPRPGSCALYKRHLHDVICAGDGDLARYVWLWLCHAVQRTAELPEVALVLRGLQGTGKGWFVRPLMEIFGSHALTVHSMEHVSGRFNAHLKDVVLLFADEAFWGGDKSREGLLKSLVTERKRLVEPKNKDAQQVDSFTRLIVATNTDWPIAMDHDDRRAVVLDVAEVKKEDEGYFRALAEELGQGGTAALLHELLSEDLTGWHPRQRPARSTGFDIKLRSSSGVAQWWHECLVNEVNQVQPVGGGEDVWDDNPPIQGLHDHYRKWCERLGRKYIESLHSFTRELRRMAPHAVTNRPGGSGKRCYKLGSLALCREAFARHFRVQDAVWDDNPGAVTVEEF